MVKTFWAIVTEGYWLARVKEERAKCFYSPRLLRTHAEDLKKRDVCHHFERHDFTHTNSHELFHSSPIHRSLLVSLVLPKIGH
jgi:hypothetical protein